MTDLAQYDHLSDSDLEAIANGPSASAPTDDYPHLSDEDLMKIAGEKPVAKENPEDSIVQYDAKTGMPYTQDERNAGVGELDKGIQSGVKQAPFWLGDMMNAASQGAAKIGGEAYMGLGGELSPEQATALTNLTPFIGSPEILKAAGMPIAEGKTGLTTMGNLIGGSAAAVGAPTMANKISAITGESLSQKLLNTFGDTSALDKEGNISTSGGSPPDDGGGGGGGPPTTSVAPQSPEESFGISPRAMERAKAILQQAHKDEGVSVSDIADALKEGKATGAPITALDAAQREIGGVPVSGQNFQGLAMAASRMPGKGASLAGDMAARGYLAKERIGKIMDEHISSDKAYNISDQALSDMETNAPPAYQKAFEQAPVHSDRVAGFLQEPEVQAGIKRGMQIQRLEARANDEAFNPMDYGITGFNDAGDPIISGTPNMRLLDAGKKGLDAMIRDNTDITGKTNELGRALNQVKKSYVSTLDEINPAYADARQSFADPASRMSALEKGRNFMKMDKEEIEKFVKNPETTEAEKKAFLGGVRREMQDRMSKVGDNANAITRLWKEDIRDKLEPLFDNKEAFNAFSKRMKQEATIADNNYVVRGNSITMKAQQYGKHIDQPPSNILSKAASFVRKPVSTTAGAGLDMLSDSLKKSAGNMSSDTAAAIMHYLTTQDPAVWRTLDAEAKRSIMSKAASNPAIGLAAGGAALGAGIIASKNAQSAEPQNNPKYKNMNQLLDDVNKDKILKLPAKPESKNQVPKSFQQAEGFKPKVYKDTTGHRTVGSGFNMDSGIAKNVWDQAGINKDFNAVRNGKQKITEQESQKLLEKSYEIASGDAKNLIKNFDTLSKNRKEAMTHLAFQYGKTRLKEALPGVLSSVDSGNFPAAAARLLASDYGKKYKIRAKALANMLYNNADFSEG